MSVLDAAPSTELNHRLISTAKPSDSEDQILRSCATFAMGAPCRAVLRHLEVRVNLNSWSRAWTWRNYIMTLNPKP